MDTQAHDLAIVEHYKHYFGQEARAVRFAVRPQPASPSVVILEFPPLADGGPLGSCNRGCQPQPAVSTSELRAEGRIELVLLSRERHDDLIDLLEALSAYPFLTSAHLGAGHTIAGSPGHGVVHGSPLTEILLAHPHFETPDFEVIHHADGSHTHTLWVVPIYLSERTLIKENGYVAFEKHLADKQADPRTYGAGRPSDEEGRRLVRGMPQAAAYAVEHRLT